MICPKCGRNIEGTLCPYCDEPQIDDNTDEYLKRKSAYEESLKDTEPEPEERQTGGRKFKRRYAVITLAAIGAALAVALVSTHLPRSFDGRLYTESGGKVFSITDGGLSETTGRMFSSEGKSVYAEVREPEGISAVPASGLKGYAASSNGEYFALTQLEDNGTDDNYSLYIWNKNGDFVKALSQKDVITVRDVTNSGEVIYTTSPVLNDQWYTGDDVLHIYKVTGASGGSLTGESKKIGDSVQSFFIYENVKALVCLDKSGQLYTCPGYDPEKRVLISDGVTKVLPENGDEDNYFSSAAASVNTSKSADLIAYLRDGIWSLTDTGGRIGLTLGAAGENTEFIYDDSNRVLYKAEGAGLSRCILSDSGLTDWEAIGTVGENLLWDAHKSTLIFETSEGGLARAETGNVTEIAREDAGVSLYRIFNGEGYVYRSDDGIFVTHDIKGVPVRLSGEISGEIRMCAQIKGMLYIYAGDGLYTVDRDGRVTESGSCEGLYVI